MKVIETERLILRTWEDDDAEPYYRINQDPKVLEFLPGPMTINQAKVFIFEMNQRFTEYNYTLWAAEEKATASLMGFIGLQVPRWQAHFSPCVEVGWRLGSEYWGKGYAPEGARAALDYGFNTLNFSEIVSFTVPANHRSIRVMEKIGMQRDFEGDFEHPNFIPDHPLCKHVLYRVKG